MHRFQTLHIAIFVACALIIAPCVNSFSVQSSTIIGPSRQHKDFRSVRTTNYSDRQSFLQAQGSGDESTPVLSLSESDQVTVGVVGTKMSLIMLCSEYVLKTTGCGLPAGPYGLIGAAEGISYLGVTALAAFSIFTKVKTGSGLPAGPKGILGLAEGLSFLAIAVGVGVLLFQVLDYGYIPNAVPFEGGICQ